MIQIKNLCKTYDGAAGKVTALNNIDLTVNDGEIYGIIGMSGAGKSTLVRCINMLERPTSGDIVIDGVSMTSLSPAQLREARRNITMIFQGFNLLMQKNCLKNVCFPMELAGVPKDKAAKRAAELLEMVGLPDKAKAYPAQLSGGQQQRVAIARALVNEPEVLLLDEPLGALDLKLRKEMQIELKRMQKKLGITFIFVTHDQEEALTMSDTIAVMNHGIIQQIGCPTDVYNEPKNRFVARFIGESNIFEATMRRDYLVNIHGIDYECVDAGFGTEQPVDVVIRPEDVDFVPIGKTPLHGVVTSVLFMGVHYEFTVDCDGRIFKVHSTDFVPVGETVGIEVLPDAIHIMNPERRQPAEAAAEEPQQNL